MQRFADDMDALSWLFHTKLMSEIFKDIVDIREAGQTLRELQELATSDSSAVSVADRLTHFQAAIGPPFMREFITSGELCEVCPRSKGSPEWPPLDQERTVWSNSRGERVVAEDRTTHHVFVVK